MRIIGIRLYGGSDSVIKNLKPGWYPFGDYQEPTLENNWQWMTETQRQKEKYCNRLYKSVSSDDLFSPGFEITVNSIVGKNGAGKTTLLELLFRIINNFSYYLIDKSWVLSDSFRNPQLGHELHESLGYQAKLYFETDGNVGEVKIYRGRASYSYHGKKDETIELPTKKPISSTKLQSFLQSFFYTICSNYSIYSLVIDNETYGALRTADRIVDNKWISGILHKNDGYLAPIVMVPFREEDTINVKTETILATQRLSTLGMLFLSQGKTFMDEYEPAELKYRFKLESPEIYKNRLNKLIEKKLQSKGDVIKEQFRIAWMDWLMATNGFNEKPEIVKEAILSYLLYKTVKICLTYREFGVMIGLQKIEEEIQELDCQNKDKEMMVVELPLDFAKHIVSKIMTEEEPSHVTLKIHQVIEFIRRGFYCADDPKNIIEVDDLLGVYDVGNLKAFLEKNLQYDFENQISDKKRNRYEFFDEVFLIMPPAIFEWELSFRKKGEKDNLVTLDKMSSGEKQILQSFSYMLYHIKNLQSVKEGAFHISYHHVSLIFDEAELYYHPEFQRDFIANIIKMLAWCHIDQRRIRSVNIMVVTHSPFVLSDVMVENTLNMEQGKVQKKVRQTFGANIHELLYDQFIVDSIGAVVRGAVNSIGKLYKDYQKSEKKADVRKNLVENYDYYQFLASSVSEPFLKNNLTMMLEEIMAPKTRLEKMEAEFKELSRKQEVLRLAIEKEKENKNEENRIS